jgi:hypothetical protein
MIVFPSDVEVFVTVSYLRRLKTSIHLGVVDVIRCSRLFLEPNKPLSYLLWGFNIKLLIRLLLNE